MSDGPGRKPTISDDEILAIFENSDDPVLTTKEVAEHLTISPRGTLKRLDSLAEEGKLVSKEVGARSVVWWRPGHTDTSTPDHSR